MINWLSVDTSMKPCGVGVPRADGQMFEMSERMDRGQAERLMPMIIDVLARAGLGFGDIGAYAVTVGPGTFTGLRVGLSTVRALGLVSGKPVVGVGTFDALAAAVPDRPLCVVVETKRSDYYARFYGADGACDDGACLGADELRARLTPDMVLAGDALARLRAQTGITNHGVDSFAPQAAHLIALAGQSLAAGTALPPEPVYLRGADVSVSRRKVARIV